MCTSSFTLHAPPYLSSYYSLNINSFIHALNTVNKNRETEGKMETPATGTCVDILYVVNYLIATAGDIEIEIT